MVNSRRHKVDGERPSNARIYSTCWKPKISLKEGIQPTYPWVEEQVKAAKSMAAAA